MTMYDRSYALLSFLLTTFLAVFVSREATKETLEGVPHAWVSLSLAIPVATVFFLGWRHASEFLLSWKQRYRWFSVVGLLLVPLLSYGCYALSRGDVSFEAVWKLSVFLVVPAVLLLWKPPQHPGFCWQDGVALACMYLPFDQRFPDDIWSNPAGLSYAYASMLVITQGYFMFVILRGLQGVNFSFMPTRQDLSQGLWYFVVCLALVVPPGLLTGFLEFNPQQLSPIPVLLSFIGIFLSIAAIEELIFRGILQNLLIRRFQNPYWMIAITAVLFGLSHWNNSKSLDWRYLTLASVAGFVYGLAYYHSKSLFAPMLTHTLIDTTWKHLLHT